MKTSFCSHSYSDNVITVKFCACHDSCAVMACAKICSDTVAVNGIAVKWNFHHIWIMMEKALVKWTSHVHGQSLLRLMDTLVWQAALCVGFWWLWGKLSWKSLCWKNIWVLLSNCQLSPKYLQETPTRSHIGAKYGVSQFVFKIWLFPTLQLSCLLQYFARLVVYCETSVSPLLMHWRYHSFTLSHQYCTVL